MKMEKVIPLGVIMEQKEKLKTIQVEVVSLLGARMKPMEKAFLIPLGVRM